MPAREAYGKNRERETDQGSRKISADMVVCGLSNTLQSKRISHVNVSERGSKLSNVEALSG